MKKFIFLIFVALFAIAVLLFIFNPQLLEDIWLWIVGLIGTIIAAIRNGINSLLGFFKDDEKEESSKTTDQPKSVAVDNSPIVTKDTNNENQSGLVDQYETKIQELQNQILILQNKLKTSNIEDQFQGTTLTVLRYFDDGETTLGLLFLDDQFFSYTLEDTYREVKIQGVTRIPQGNYKLSFNRVLTPLTKKYRKSRAWFEYHLHVKDVPNYQNVYIHSGSTHQHTEGCLLVADSILSSDDKRSIFNSRKTFERLYKKLKPIIDSEVNVRIRYFDEDWFERAKISRIVA